MILANTSRLTAAMCVLTAVSLVLVPSAAKAQALTVLPVNVFFSPGQNATSLAVTNSGQTETAVQIRAYAWNENDGSDQLVDTDEVLLSPPIAKIAPGAAQVVRIILRHPPKRQETTYRILIDQIPPPEEPGIVHLVLRLSIPIFAMPPSRCNADVSFHIDRDAGQFYLVATNSGTLHEALRDLELTTNDDRKLKLDAPTLSYILPGVTRRWHIIAPDSGPFQLDSLRLKAHMNAGTIDRQVSFVAVR